MRARQLATPAGRLRVPALAGVLLVSACAGFQPFGGGSNGTVAPGTAPPVPGTAPEALPGTPATARKVAVLLPLTGPNGSLGTSMLRGAQLAMDAPNSPTLDVVDTNAPGGIDHAAAVATGNGDSIILGPLTSAHTAAVAPVATAAGIPVLAFTSDVDQARPGVWVLGVTPEQQVRRLVFAAKADGRNRMAALLPDNPLGTAMAAALTRVCAEAGLPPPTIITHTDSPDSIRATVNEISDLSTRQASQAAAQQQLQAGSPAPGTGTASGTAPAAAPAGDMPSAVDPVPGVTPGPAPGSTAATPGAAPGATPAATAPLPPPPFDALLVADTGLQLQTLIGALADAHVSAPAVRIMGPGLWSAFASKLGALSGAWYAAPDPASRLGFNTQYRAKYGQSPKLLADIAYDAAAVARALAPTGYDASALERPDGFAGVDGVFALMPDGHVHRALAVFQIQPGGGGTIVQPAPMTITAGQS